VDGQSEPFGAGGDGRPDVGPGAEPQLAVISDSSGEDLGVPQTAAEAAGETGGAVEEWAGVENLKDFGVRPAESGPILFGQEGEDTGELASAGIMQRLQEPPVPHGGKGHIVVGHFLGPQVQDHTNRDVLVDDDHGRSYSDSASSLLTAEVGVLGRDAIQLGLEISHQVTCH
jgi:hypothetical protein